MEPIPQPWAKRMQQRGVPSYARLADKAEIAVETVRRAIRGKGKPSPDTMRAIQSVLGDDVEQWFGVKLNTPYTPPKDADLLSDDERGAIDQIIRLMAKSKRQRPANVTELTPRAPRTPAVPAKRAARKDTK